MKTFGRFDKDYGKYEIHIKCIFRDSSIPVTFGTLALREFFAPPSTLNYISVAIIAKKSLSDKMNYFERITQKQRNSNLCYYTDSEFGIFSVANALKTILMAGYNLSYYPQIRKNLKQGLEFVLKDLKENYVPRKIGV